MLATTREYRMKRPVWMIVFPLLLSGCSSLGVSNWMPTSWFGSSDTVTGDSVLGLDADTPVTRDAISRQLGDGFQIRTGMQSNGADVLPYAEVRQNDARVMTVNGKADGQISSVDIDSPEIKTEWELMSVAGSAISTLKRSVPIAKSGRPRWTRR
ncbi:DUF1131 family protein [Plesiomonas shigelloides subsp. oncorhynchi]|nr:DUF1131 family protein [Plesiomonas shigelloides]